MKALLASKKFLMIVSMVLMVSVVASMGAVTFARYVSSSESEETQATVAKWGYVVTLNAADMFGKKYENNAIVADSTADTDSDKVDVVASGASKVVAPGTSGEVSVTISGIAEVLAQLKIELYDDDDSNTDVQDVVLTLTNKTDDSTITYNPIKWTLYEGSTPVTACQNVTLAQLETYLTSNYNSKLPAGTAISPAKVYRIAWHWDFNTGANESEINTNNVYDTILGLLSNGMSANDIEAIYTNYEIDEANTNTVLKYCLKATIEQIQD